MSQQAKPPTVAQSAAIRAALASHGTPIAETTAILGSPTASSEVYAEIQQRRASGAQPVEVPSQTQQAPEATPEDLGPYGTTPRLIGLGKNPVIQEETNAGTLGIQENTPSTTSTNVYIPKSAITTPNEPEFQPQYVISQNISPAEIDYKTGFLTTTKTVGITPGIGGYRQGSIVSNPSTVFPTDVTVITETNTQTIPENIAPKLGVFGKFLTGVVYAGPLYLQEGQNLLQTTDVLKASANPLKRGAAYATSIAATSLIATGAFLSFYNPQGLNFSTGTPEQRITTISEAGGLAIQFIGFSAAFSGLQKVATGFKFALTGQKLGFFGRAALGFGVGFPLGAIQTVAVGGNPIAGGALSGTLFAVLPEAKPIGRGILSLASDTIGENSLFRAATGFVDLTSTQLGKTPEFARSLIPPYPAQVIESGIFQTRASLELAYGNLKLASIISEYNLSSATREYVGTLGSGFKGVLEPIYAPFIARATNESILGVEEYGFERVGLYERLAPVRSYLTEIGQGAKGVIEPILSPFTAKTEELQIFSEGLANLRAQIATIPARAELAGLALRYYPEFFIGRPALEYASAIGKGFKGILEPITEPFIAPLRNFGGFEFDLGNFGRRITGQNYLLREKLGLTDLQFVNLEQEPGFTRNPFSNPFKGTQAIQNIQDLIEQNVSDITAAGRKLKISASIFEYKNLTPALSYNRELAQIASASIYSGGATALVGIGFGQTSPEQIGKNALFGAAAGLVGGLLYTGARLDYIPSKEPNTFIRDTFPPNEYNPSTFEFNPRTGAYEIASGRFQKLAQEFGEIETGEAGLTEQELTKIVNENLPDLQYKKFTEPSESILGATSETIVTSGNELFLLKSETKPIQTTKEIQKQQEKYEQEQLQIYLQGLKFKQAEQYELSFLTTPQTAFKFKQAQQSQFKFVQDLEYSYRTLQVPRFAQSIQTIAALQYKPLQIELPKFAQSEEYLQTFAIPPILKTIQKRKRKGRRRGGKGYKEFRNELNTILLGPKGAKVARGFL